MPNHRNVYISLATSVSKTGKFQLTPLVYEQKYILKNEELYKELEKMFSIYANNASKYCVSASSQSNESFNNIVSHKFPKNKSYSTSPSGDLRVASAVLSKNEGNSYLVEVKQSLNVPISSNLEKLCQITDNNRLKRADKQKMLRRKYDG